MQLGCLGAESTILRVAADTPVGQRLEGGSSVSFASGMAGIDAIFDQLPTGLSLALPDDCYQGVAYLDSSIAK